MESLPREKIEEISRRIIESGDIIAKHGTSVENAEKILETGFNYNKTSYVIQSSHKIETLYGYGWKENPPGDATNVIIEVPREFFKELFRWNDEQYNSWISNVKKRKLQEFVLKGLEDEECEKPNELDPNIECHIPREFVAGAFIWCNNMTYLRLGPNDDAANHLNFIENEHFYSNLSSEEKKKFVELIRRKMYAKKDNQSKNKKKKTNPNFDDESPGGDDR